jgi:hypothetical protein
MQAWPDSAVVLLVFDKGWAGVAEPKVLSYGSPSSTNSQEPLIELDHSSKTIVYKSIYHSCMSAFYCHFNVLKNDEGMVGFSFGHKVVAL